MSEEKNRNVPIYSASSYSDVHWIARANLLFTSLLGQSWETNLELEDGTGLQENLSIAQSRELPLWSHLISVLGGPESESTSYGTGANSIISSILYNR